MARTRRARGRKRRKATPGSFKPGPDRRRHVFTTQDCRIGYWVAAIKHPELREWLLRKIRIYYSTKAREDRNGQEEAERRAGGAARDGDGHAAAGAPAAASDDVPW